MRKILKKFLGVTALCASVTATVLSLSFFTVPAYAEEVLADNEVIFYKNEEVCGCLYGYWKFTVPDGCEMYFAKNSRGDEDYYQAFVFLTSGDSSVVGRIKAQNVTQVSGATGTGNFEELQRFYPYNSDYGFMLTGNFMVMTSVKVNEVKSFDGNAMFFNSVQGLYNYLTYGDSSEQIIVYNRIDGSEEGEQNSSSTIKSNCSSEITAYIPKKIVISPENINFATKAGGDLSSKKNVEISPASSEIVFTDESGTKTVTVSIENNKTRWSFVDIQNEVESTYTCNFNSADFSAGKWTAQLPFNIKIADITTE